MIVILRLVHLITCFTIASNQFLNFDFQNKKQLLRLTCESLKYKSYLEKVLDSQNVMRHLMKSKKLANDQTLCLLLVYEIIFGIGIRVTDKEVNLTLKAAKKDILFEVCVCKKLFKMVI